MKTNQLSPFIRVNSSTVQFFLNGYIYEKSENTLRPIETPAKPELKAAINAYNLFEMADNRVTWYHGKSKFVYNIHENNFLWNNSQILDESFAKHIQAAGAIRFEDIRIAELFENMPNLIGNFMILDNCATFESKDANIRVDVFIIENKVFVARYNKGTQLYKFFEESNVNNLVDYINEQTGESGLTFLQSFLDSELKEQAIKESQINVLHEMLAYLNDKREELANADRTLPEIKRADSIIKDEIENVKEQIDELLG